MSIRTYAEGLKGSAAAYAEANSQLGQAKTTVEEQAGLIFGNEAKISIASTSQEKETYSNFLNEELEAYSTVLAAQELGLTAIKSIQSTLATCTDYKVTEARLQMIQDHMTRVGIPPSEFVRNHHNHRRVVDETPLSKWAITLEQQMESISRPLKVFKKALNLALYKLKVVSGTNRLTDFIPSMKYYFLDQAMKMRPEKSKLSQAESSPSLPASEQKIADQPIEPLNLDTYFQLIDESTTTFDRVSAELDQATRDDHGEIKQQIEVIQGTLAAFKKVVKTEDHDTFIQKLGDFVDTQVRDYKDLLETQTVGLNALNKLNKNYRECASCTLTDDEMNALIQHMNLLGMNSSSFSRAQWYSMASVNDFGFGRHIAKLTELNQAMMTQINMLKGILNTACYALKQSEKKLTWGDLVPSRQYKFLDEKLNQAAPSAAASSSSIQEPQSPLDDATANEIEAQFMALNSPEPRVVNNGNF
jgi:hypothetical protein